MDKRLVVDSFKAWINDWLLTTTVRRLLPFFNFLCQSTRASVHFCRLVSLCTNEPRMLVFPCISAFLIWDTLRAKRHYLWWQCTSNKKLYTGHMCPRRFYKTSGVEAAHSGQRGEVKPGEPVGGHIAVGRKGAAPAGTLKCGRVFLALQGRKRW